MLNYASFQNALDSNLKNEEKLFNLISSKVDQEAPTKSPRSQKIYQKEMRKNEMGFMRFCMTEFGLSSNQEFLMKIPELLHAFLPISYFDKIQGIYNVEN